MATSCVTRKSAANVELPYGHLLESGEISPGSPRCASSPRGFHSGGQARHCSSVRERRLRLQFGRVYLLREFTEAWTSAGHLPIDIPRLNLPHNAGDGAGTELTEAGKLVADFLNERLDDRLALTARRSVQARPSVRRRGWT